MAQDPTHRLVIRSGLRYGAIIAGLHLVESVFAWLSLSGNSATISMLRSPGNYRLAILALGIAVALINFAAFAVPFILGLAIYKRVRQIGADALSGLIAGSVGGIVGALTSLALTIPPQLAAASSPTGNPAFYSTLIWLSVGSIAFSLAWSCASGAGLGAIGALVRQSVFG
ncbi:MAG TPA: hypothetical protein VF808_05585 [Ktedonobacterales bacterium]